MNDQPSQQRPPETAPHRPPWTRRTAYVLVAVLAALVPGAVARFTTPTSWTSPVSIASIALIVAATAALVTHLLAGRATADIEAQRERVREAERDVEGALSGRGVSVAARGTVTGGTVIHQFAPGESAAETEQRRDRRDLALARLWTLTHRRLDLYHEIATKQAQRSFISAQVSMAVGFALLLLFVVLALQVSSTAGAIVAGGLGAVSAALAGFISKTFVKSQQAAADHLKAYFDQPLEFSRYLAAERLLEDAGLTEEKKADVVAQLVRTIAAGPTATTPPDAKALIEQLTDTLPGTP